MKSERYVQVRHRFDKFILVTDLIGHDNVVNIPNQTTELICIYGIVKEALNIPLSSQQLEGLQNPFQFSTNPCSLDMNLNLGKNKPTLPVPSSSFLPCCCLWEQVYTAR